MKTKAALLVELNAPLRIVDIAIPDLKPGQVLVEIDFSGVCHTQILEARGRRGPDAFLPHCLGHEGVGRVVAVGQGVIKVGVGDPVVLGWIKGDGADIPGAVYDWDGRKVNAGGVTTFQRHAVVSENRLVRLPEGTDPALAVLLGCAAPTGFGAVLHTARAMAGQSVAVVGIGGVGLCAVVVAVAQGCAPVLAVDRNPERLEYAKAAGADAIVEARGDAIGAAIKARVPGGLDVVIEATGAVGVMERALEWVRPRGGTVVVIGNATAGATFAVDPRQLNQGKRLLGCWGGDSHPDRDLARYAGLLARGVAGSALMRAEPYSLGRINQALDDLEQGRVGRPLIDLSLPD
jgi:S-(hydroxymethyl)glutathione dehydrogenase/alcohol dehydrogenase